MTGVEHSASEMVPPAPPKSAETTYIVLVRYKATTVDTAAVAEKLWQHVGEFTARSAEAAELEYAKKATANAKQGDPALVLVAVPTRSWKPIAVRLAIETKLIFGDAS